MQVKKGWFIRFLPSVNEHGYLRATAGPKLVESDLTPMCLGRNKEKVLKRHTFFCGACCKSNALTFSEKESHSIAKLHSREMDPNARSCTGAKGVEGSLCRR